jgi:hypothetical protein
MMEEEAKKHFSYDCKR